MKQALLVLAIFLTTTLANAASFDCAKASTNIEHMICDTANISELDSKLHNVYVKAIAQACDAKDLREKQRNWLSLRDKAKDEKDLAWRYQQWLDWYISHIGHSHTEASVINKQVGKFQFEIDQGKCIEYRSYPHQVYQVSVFNSTGKRLQQIEIQSSSSPEGILSISDIDGDGYKDILFDLGVGHGPYPFIALYRFHPESNTFKQDKSFPFEGGVEKSPHRGCVYVENRTSLGEAQYGYEANEYCLSESGEWNESSNCDDSGNEKCP